LLPLAQNYLLEDISASNQDISSVSVRRARSGQNMPHQQETMWGGLHVGVPLDEETSR